MLYQRKRKQRTVYTQCLYTVIWGKYNDPERLYSVSNTRRYCGETPILYLYRKSSRSTPREWLLMTRHVMDINLAYTITKRKIYTTVEFSGLSFRDTQRVWVFESEFSRHPRVWAFGSEFSRHPRVWVFRVWGLGFRGLSFRDTRRLFADVNNKRDEIWVFAATLISRPTSKIPFQGVSLINFPIPCDLQQLSSLLKPTVERKRRNLNENRRRRTVQNVCLVTRQSINEGSLDTRTWKRLLSRVLISCFSRPMEAIDRRKTCR